MKMLSIEFQVRVTFSQIPGEDLVKIEGKNGSAITGTGNVLVGGKCIPGNQMSSLAECRRRGRNIHVLVSSVPPRTEHILCCMCLQSLDIYYKNFNKASNIP